jgi:hypothetical protein
MKIKKKIHFVVAITFYYFYKIAYEPFKMSPKICLEIRWNILLERFKGQWFMK